MNLNKGGPNIEGGPRAGKEEPPRKVRGSTAEKERVFLASSTIQHQRRWAVRREKMVHANEVPYSDTQYDTESSGSVKNKLKSRRAKEGGINCRDYIEMP